MLSRRFLLPLLSALGLIFSLFWIMINQDNTGQITNFPMKGHAVPAFTYSTLDGTPVDESLFQQDWKILNVWASWCVVCKKEHDFLMALANQGVPIIGLNYRDKKGAAIHTLDTTGNPYQTVIFDPQGALAMELGSMVTPETYLIDGQGILVHRHTGALDSQVWENEFYSRIQTLNVSAEGKS
ncbi:DsbE family thiol:disulfide interchange protein [Enterovibrio sp. ZSDZ35]|uniref:DsbE family thiol:disulfide interchange protein n=1 Tax=Enterovibrio qingdaonensis TaxID=2899818 RepID=A0ABT5QFX7_9GAMM|nr:DsbE family thiol:disulfide interchange protein [Enterovibrio sp. ZSDZ35]MDD1779891.1 DsbE family thiol:disulfide interchange protein [Enterovibrio sp. ZSDZ35]